MQQPWRFCLYKNFEKYVKEGLQLGEKVIYYVHKLTDGQLKAKQKISPIQIPMMKGNTAAKRRKGGALILIIFTLDFLDNNLPSLQKPVGFPADRLFLLPSQSTK